MKSHLRILGFDGIRGLAILSVILTHLHILKPLPDRIEDLVKGSNGVQAFFVLSGFLITMLLIKEHDETSKVSIKNFYARRALRIFPVYILFLLMVTLVSAYHLCEINGQALLFAYTYIYNFLPRDSYVALLGHTWSLAVEEHFYLIWPFIFSLLIKKSRALIAILIASFALSILAVNILSSTWIAKTFFIWRWTPIPGSNIVIGCLLAMMITGQNRNQSLVKVLRSPWTMILGLFFYIHTVFSIELPFHFGPYIKGIGIGLMITWIYLNQESRPVKFLEFSPLRWIGVISYGIYLYQGFFLSTGPERAPGQMWPPPNQFIGLSLLIIAAPLSYLFIEKPLLKLKAKF